jgi:acetyl-CoA carboxylase carboxyl transferase subunit beta
MARAAHNRLRLSKGDPMAETQTPDGPYDASALSGPTNNGRKKDMPNGLWMKCPSCDEMLYRKVVADNDEVCPKCQQHFRTTGRQRVAQLVDEGTFEELFTEIQPSDPLNFHWQGKKYSDRLAAEQKKTGNTEALICGRAYIKGRRVALAAMAGDFLMGSMGSVLGEKLARTVELATDEMLPLIVVCISGGARMHEGALSLMQMAKTSAALARYDRAGGLYVALLTDPTTGGTTASFAMLGDVIIAEPKALIGFAGPRVIANTIKAELPEGFQRAEFLQTKGFVDLIVHRHELRSELAKLIDFTMPA